MNLESAYREHIRFLAARRSDSFVLNGKPEHAAALFEALFDFAENQVAFLCRNMSSDVFERSEVIEAMERSVNRGVSIRGLIQVEQVEAMEFLKASVLANQEGRKIEIRYVGNQSDPAFNFAVADRRAFRFEKNPNVLRAVASFNQSDTALKLQRVFDTIWTGSEVLHGNSFPHRSELASI